MGMNKGLIAVVMMGMAWSANAAEFSDLAVNSGNLKAASISIPVPVIGEVKNEAGQRTGLAADFEASQSFTGIHGLIDGQNISISGLRSDGGISFSIKVPGYGTIAALYNGQTGTMSFMNGEKLVRTESGDPQVYAGTLGGKAVKLSAEAKYDLGYNDTFYGDGFSFTLKQKGEDNLRITGSYEPARYPPAALGGLLSCIVAIHMSDFLEEGRLSYSRSITALSGTSSLSDDACGWQDPSADREFTFEGGPFNYTGEAERALSDALAALDEAGYYVTGKSAGYYSYTVTFLAPPSAEIKTLVETFFSSAGLQEKADARVKALKRRGATVLEKRVASSGYTIRYLVARPVPCETGPGR